MEQYNHRNLVTKSKGKIIVNENELDIFSTDRSPRERWEPDRELMPYNRLKQLVIDIETSGLSSQTDRIYAIGCMDENWQVTIFMESDESSLLQKFVRHVSGYCADVVLSFNGTQFDLPFLIARCKKYNIRHPFKIADKLRTIQTAQVFGQPLKIHQVYVKGSQHVDVYICVLRWDYVNKCLHNARSLKQAVLEMGLRQQQRLVLPYQQILECWQQGSQSQGWAKIRQYLIYDLEDTKLIADKLVPSYYYESLVVPRMNLQQLAITGNGTKWQRVFENQYPTLRPTANRKMQFDGGLVISVPGMHRNVAKIDVASLYPSIMLKYGICSGKDLRRVGLSILEYLTQERLRLKQLAKAGDIDASHAQSALKVAINSLFGFLGTSGLSFNDMEAAALVTAYGRRILQFAIKFIQTQGGIQVESDTDGIFFSHPQPVQVYQSLQAAMPEGIDIELETQATAMFVPQRGAKNYILWHDDGSVTTKGIWRKRDRSQLEKEFPLQYLTYFLENPQTAETYYQSIKQQLSSGSFPISKLQITRKIKKGEKNLLRLGSTGEVVTFYQGIEGVTNCGDYSSGYYLEIVARKRQEILDLVAPEILGNRKVQLSLF